MDIELNYIEKGYGKPLILLHGNGGDHTYFEHQIEAFSNYFRVIAIDTRGHGLSPRGTAPFTIAQFAEDLLSFIKEKSIEKPHILGFSDGANIALAFAIKYSLLIDKLIINGADLHTSGVKRSFQVPIEIGYKMAKFFARNNEKSIRNVEMLNLMVNEPNIDKHELQKIKNNTLVIAGTNDMIKESHTRLIHENIPNAELAFIKGNHFVANKNWNDYNCRILQFFNNE